MNRSAYAYLAVVAVLAAGVLAALLSVAPIAVGWHDFLGVLIFMALAAFSEILALDFGVSGNRQASSSISFLPQLAAIVSFSPAVVVPAMAVSVLCAEIVRRKRPWIILFNTAQIVLCYGLGALAYYGIGGAPAAEGQTSLPGFVALAMIVFPGNFILVAGLMAVRQRSNFSAMLRQIAGPSGANLLYDLLASPIAILAAFLYHKWWIAGILWMVLPLELLRHSYLSKLQLERVNKDLLKVLVKAIETRDPYTSGHSLRVSTLARAIAEDMGLSRRQIEKVETAALLHDIGKIDALYAELISKPHDLTPDERAIIRTHATKGAELLRNLSAFGEDIIKAVRHHHERYDGKGYPDGLAGEHIPIAARIIMLCDSVDAMLSDRPYRPARTVEFTEEEIQRCAGSQFDPKIVAVVLRHSTLLRATQLVKEDVSELGLVTI